MLTKGKQSELMSEKVFQKSVALEQRDIAVIDNLAQQMSISFSAALRLLVRGGQEAIEDRFLNTNSLLNEANQSIAEG